MFEAKHMYPTKTHLIALRCAPAVHFFTFWRNNYLGGVVTNLNNYSLKIKIYLFAIGKALKTVS